MSAFTKRERLLSRTRIVPFVSTPDPDVTTLSRRMREHRGLFELRINRQHAVSVDAAPVRSIAGAARKRLPRAAGGYCLPAPVAPRRRPFTDPSNE